MLQRRLARLTRRLAGAWCGVPIAEAYQSRPAVPLTFTRPLSWVLGDRATWRDLLWTVVNGVAGWILAALARRQAHGLDRHQTRSAARR